MRDQGRKICYHNGTMKQLRPDLWQTTLHHAGPLNTYAYFLTRAEGGNVLFYHTDNEDDLAEIDDLGGIRLQALTHRDEAGPGLVTIRRRFGATLAASSGEMPHIIKHAPVGREIDASTFVISTNIKVIHTPGHSVGSICYLYDSPHGEQYLFTGDTIFQWDGEWSGLVVGNAGGKVDDLCQSLARLGTLNPDLVMSSGFVGPDTNPEIPPGSWSDIINSTISRLRD